MLKYFVLGFVVKLVTGFDDTLTHIPVMASVTKSRLGRFAFAAGIVLAIIAAIIIALFFAHLIHDLPYANVIAASLLFMLAIAIYFDWFVHEKRKKIQVKFKQKRISNARVAKLIGVGFVTAFATVIDDTLAYAALFLAGNWESVLATVGIFVALAVQLVVIFKFSELVMRFKYKDELAAAGLTVLGVLVLIGIV